MILLGIIGGVVAIVDWSVFLAGHFRFADRCCYAILFWCGGIAEFLTAAVGLRGFGPSCLFIILRVRLGGGCALGCRRCKLLCPIGLQPEVRPEGRESILPQGHRVSSLIAVASGMKNGTRTMVKSVPSGSPVPVEEDPIVFVIDDDPLTRGSLSSLFRSVGLGVKAFASATELMENPLPAVPSCFVLDVRLPRLSGFDLQRELSRLGVRIPIIFITGHGDIPMSVRAMKAGAVDFLTKPFRDQEILDAVTGALARDQKRRSEERSDSDMRARFESLTPREREIMALVTAGLMNKQVGGRIGISEMTVKIHRGHVMRKMGTKSLADLVLIAEKLGIRGQNKD